MVVNLGQRPTRATITRGDPLLVPLNEELPAETLVTSEIIAGLITYQYESPMRYGRSISIRLADGQIRPDQRFYDREFEVAAQILAARSPTTETAENWYSLMKNYMGYRIVPVPFCSYGQEPDSVTRQCVTMRAERLPPIPEPEGEKEDKTSLIIPLGIIGIVAVLMLGGSK
jgi:hypothetical protein